MTIMIRTEKGDRLLLNERARQTSRCPMSCHALPTRVRTDPRSLRRASTAPSTLGPKPLDGEAFHPGRWNQVSAMCVSLVSVRPAVTWVAGWLAEAFFFGRCRSEW